MVDRLKTYVLERLMINLNGIGLSFELVWGVRDPGVPADLPFGVLHLRYERCLKAIARDDSWVKQFSPWRKWTQ